MWVYQRCETDLLFGEHGSAKCYRYATTRYRLASNQREGWLCGEHKILAAHLEPTRPVAIEWNNRPTWQEPVGQQPDPTETVQPVAAGEEQ